MTEIKISVIIPFYNANDFIVFAIESAVCLPEVGEILLIDDGSHTYGFSICTELANRFSKIKLLQHPNGENRGPSCSRNLGILNAHYDYIAFLDADDYYLPNRFSKTIDIFSACPELDGVYEAVGVIFENESNYKLFSQTPISELITIKKYIEPKILFDELMNLKAKYGSLHLNGLTVNKKIFQKTGIFDERLRLHQDTEFIWRLMAMGSLMPGNIESPVAIWRGHDNNRITYHLSNKRKHYKSSIEMWLFFYNWCKGNLPLSKQKLVILRVIAYLRKIDNLDDFTFNELINSRFEMVKLAIKIPSILINYHFWRLLIPSKKIFTLKR